SQAGGGDVVATGDRAGTCRKRRERNAACADVGEVGGAHREKFSIDAKRELDLGDEVPPLVIGEEGFGARGGELDRAPELARSPECEAIFHVYAILGSEVAADVAADDAKVSWLDSEDRSEVFLVTNSAASARVEGVPARARVVGRERRARFDRNRSASCDVKLHLDNVAGFGECAIGRF